jgi:hypothetical protein
MTDVRQRIATPAQFSTPGVTPLPPWAVMVVAETVSMADAVALLRRWNGFSGRMLLVRWIAGIIMMGGVDDIKDSLSHMGDECIRNTHIFTTAE